MCDKLPLSPVMASVLLPVGVELVVEMLSVEVPAPVIEAGLKPVVAPVGCPVTLKATFPLKVFCGVTVTV